MKNTINIECKVTALSDKFASAIFNLAAKRLLNVNRWSRLNDSLLDRLELTDESGNAINDREILQNDHLKINIDRGEQKYNWVKVEKVKLERNEDAEILTLKARPVPGPFKEAMSEKFSESGSIRIVKKGLHITAGVYAEQSAGNSAQGQLPKRNAHTTLGAYRIQWRSLVNGILCNLNEIESQRA